MSWMDVKSVFTDELKASTIRAGACCRIEPSGGSLRTKYAWAETLAVPRTREKAISSQTRPAFRIQRACRATGLPENGHVLQE